MTWRMPAETAPHERTWMAFPRAGLTLGDDPASAEEAYAAWTAVAHAVAEFEPVTMVVDPIERDRARRMLSADIEQLEAPLDDFWMRDIGPDLRARRRAAGRARRASTGSSTAGARPKWATWEQGPRDRPLRRRLPPAPSSSRRCS